MIVLVAMLDTLVQPAFVPATPSLRWAGHYLNRPRGRLTKPARGLPGGHNLALSELRQAASLGAGLGFSKFRNASLKRWPAPNLSA